MVEAIPQATPSDKSNIDNSQNKIPEKLDKINESLSKLKPSKVTSAS